jgi:hypothetical protein
MDALARLLSHRANWLEEREPSIRRPPFTGPIIASRRRGPVVPTPAVPSVLSVVCDYWGR